MLMLVRPELILNSSNFTNNSGSALLILSTELVLYSQNLFQNSQADDGAAIYFAGNSHLVLRSSNASSAQFIGNVAKFRGGEIFVDFTIGSSSCILVTVNSQDINHDDYNLISFVHNSADIVGNDI